MTNKEILQADMLDILFEHRNKTYGAYALRREYNQRLGTALGIALSIALLAILSSFFKKDSSNNSDPLNNKGGVVIKIIDLPKDPPKEPERPKEKIKEVQSTSRIIISKEESTVNTQEEIKVANVGTKDIEGDLPEDPNRNTNTGTGNNGIIVDKEPEQPFIEAKPSGPARFPAGEAAWLNFLRRYLQTPGELEPGQRIEVRVRFWIDVDGSVSRFEIVQSGGPAFDKEVLRVMKKMPGWEPAIQNGIKVSVSFTQPVIFIGAEE